MELKASTTILLLDFAIGSPSLFGDTHGLPHVAMLCASGREIRMPDVAARRDTTEAC